MELYGIMMELQLVDSVLKKEICVWPIVNTLSDVKKKTLYLQYMLNRIYSK